MAQRVSEASGGAFDVTVGPLVNAWGFGPEGRAVDPPSDEEVAALRERVGYRMLEVDEEAQTIRKARPDLYCDLSAIAKGYGVDKVAESLEQAGFQDYMVEIGGEVRARGRNRVANTKLLCLCPATAWPPLETIETSTKRTECGSVTLWTRETAGPSSIILPR